LYPTTLAVRFGSMWSWLRLKKKSSSVDDAELLRRDIEACTLAMNRKVLALTERYSVPAVSVALAMHLNVALRACISRREMTEDQARVLTQRLLDPAFTGAEMEREFAAQAKLRGTRHGD
jgi:hypothetical protein